MPIETQYPKGSRVEIHMTGLRGTILDTYVAEDKRLTCEVKMEETGEINYYHASQLVMLPKPTLTATLDLTAEPALRAVGLQRMPEPEETIEVILGGK